MTPPRTILIVDDIPMFRDLVAVFLARTARILTASSGEEGLAVAEREHLDLLIADLHMPGMDGAELCRRIKCDPRLGEIPVLMLLRGKSIEDSARAVSAGANDMLCKPLSRGALIQAANHFLEGGLSRGLPRVELASPVQLNALHEDFDRTWGTARNISRGGIFVEADCELRLKAEVNLDLTLPDRVAPISPTAQVVWSREDEDRRLSGLGMRFLNLDADSMRALDDFITERLPLHVVPIESIASVAPSPDYS